MATLVFGNSLSLKAFLSFISFVQNCQPWQKSPLPQGKKGGNARIIGWFPPQVCLGGFWAMESALIVVYLKLSLVDGLFSAMVMIELYSSSTLV